MFEFRVTKYDPAHRDRRGAYTRDDWTSVDDIGRTYGGSVLTAAEYRQVEDAYVTSAVAVLREAGVPCVTVSGLENHVAAPLPFSDGSSLASDQVGEVVRQLLREKFWCRLEGPGAFVHVGYDYYMYIGVHTACPDTTALARRLGLFVEPFQSPYRR